MTRSNALQEATIVKWDNQKGFGFARTTDHVDVFIHSRMVNNAEMYVDMKVSLNYRENPRRRGQYEASTVKLDEGFAG